VSEPQDLWEPIGGPLLPDGLSFPPFDTSLLAQGLNLAGPYGRRPGVNRSHRPRPTVVRAATWEPAHDRRRLLAVIIAAVVLLMVGAMAGIVVA
jgi:hypothetical protein